MNVWRTKVEYTKEGKEAERHIYSSNKLSEESVKKELSHLLQTGTADRGTAFVVTEERIHVRNSADGIVFGKRGVGMSFLKKLNLVRNLSVR